MEVKFKMVERKLPATIEDVQLSWDIILLAIENSKEIEEPKWVFPPMGNILAPIEFDISDTIMIDKVSDLVEEEDEYEYDEYMFDEYTDEVVFKATITTGLFGIGVMVGFFGGLTFGLDYSSTMAFWIVLYIVSGLGFVITPIYGLYKFLQLRKRASLDGKASCDKCSKTV